MSNDRKNVNERGGTDTDAADRHDTPQNTGQSQDASRHQQDAAHHKGYKGPQQGADSQPAASGPAQKTTKSK